jgi:hypothetical protein
MLVTTLTGAAERGNRSDVLAETCSRRFELTKPLKSVLEEVIAQGSQNL